jgi:predicted transcriptional regulator
MAHSSPPRPTNVELDILRVLWARGPATVREVCDGLNATRPTSEASGYTTVLKMMQIMTEKGLLERDERDRAHVYKPRVEREKTQRAMVGHLLDRVFAGSAADLMLQALAAKEASPEEIRQLRELLATYEGKPKKGAAK